MALLYFISVYVRLNSPATAPEHLSDLPPHPSSKVKPFSSVENSTFALHQKQATFVIIRVVMKEVFEYRNNKWASLTSRVCRPPFSDKVKNVWSFTPTTLHAFTVWYVINYEYK
jgi:hypothetical protein